MKTLVPLADGVEEMEAAIIIDVLRRANWCVVAAALHQREVTGSHGIKILADALWQEIKPDDFDLIALPGGAAGVEAFLAFPPLLEALRTFSAAGKPLAAICAAPLALQAAGALENRTATAHPTVMERLKAARSSTTRVVVDGNMITSRGPGTAFEFALALVRRFDNPAKADNLAQAMLVEISATPAK